MNRQLILKGIRILHFKEVSDCCLIRPPPTLPAYLLRKEPLGCPYPMLFSAEWVQFRERVRLYSYSGLALVLLRFQGGEARTARTCFFALFSTGRDETGFSSPLLSPLDFNRERSCIPLPFFLIDRRTTHLFSTHLPFKAGRIEAPHHPQPASLRLGAPVQPKLGGRYFTTEFGIQHTSAREPSARARL